MNHCFFRRLSALLLIVAFCIGMTACDAGEKTETSSAVGTDVQDTERTTTATRATRKVETTTAAQPEQSPLVVAYNAFSQCFSPFIATSEADWDVVNMTQIAITTTDRDGNPVYNGIEGETRTCAGGKEYTYTGPADLTTAYDEETDITTCTVKLREDLYFSDGVPVTADDLIFTCYVFLDSAYSGSCTLNTLPIIGLQEYRQNNSAAGSFSITAEDISALEANPEGTFKDYLTDLVSGILRDELTQLHTLYEDEAYAALTTEYPEVKDFFYEIYGTDSQYDVTAEASETAVLEKVIEEYGCDYRKLAKVYAEDEDYFDEQVDAQARTYCEEQAMASLDGEAVSRIEGIEKLDEYTMQIQLVGKSNAAAGIISALPITPMHYYGDVTLYRYEEDSFGFERGNLESILRKTFTPMGAGPYCFTGYEDGTVSFTANEYYYKGEPQIQNVQFVEMESDSIVSALQAGTVDIAELGSSQNAAQEIDDNLCTVSIEYPGYGYIGINPNTVSVFTESESEYSRNLRRAFATLFAVYREESLERYYGGTASVLETPTAAVSWLSIKTGSQAAYSTDVDGNDIYTDAMSREERYDAALKAAENFLIAAGYQWNYKEGYFDVAPQYAALSYSILICDNGNGSHPLFWAVNQVKEALASIGFTLVIQSVDEATLQSKIAAGTHELWCGAWDTVTDPDTLMLCHTDADNPYRIQDDTLSDLAKRAVAIEDKSQREKLYQTYFRMVSEWAVEIPCYQRCSAVIFNSDRIKADTITPDMTPEWRWINDIERLELAEE